MPALGLGRSGPIGGGSGGGASPFDLPPLLRSFLLNETGEHIYDSSGRGTVGDFGQVGFPAFSRPNPGWTGGGITFGPNGEISFADDLTWGDQVKCIDVVCEVGGPLDEVSPAQSIWRSYPNSHFPGFAACDRRMGVYTGLTGSGYKRSAIRIEGPGIGIFTFEADGVSRAGCRMYMNDVEVEDYFEDPAEGVPTFDDGQAVEKISLSGVTGGIGGFLKRMFCIFFYSAPLTAEQRKARRPFLDNLVRSRGAEITPRAQFLTPLSAPRIFAIGDSIVQGVNDVAGGGWPARLQIARAAANQRVSNFGIGGIHSVGLDAAVKAQVIRRIGTSGRDIAIIACGTNGAFGTAELDANKQLAADLLAAGVWKVGLATGLPKAIHEAARQTFNTGIREYVKATPGTFRVEFGANPNMGQAGQQADTDYYEGDGVHPRPGGFDEMDTVSSPATDAAWKWQPSDIPGCRVCQVAGLLRDRGTWYTNADETTTAVVGDPVRRGAGQLDVVDLTAPDDASRPELVELGDGVLATEAASGTRLLFDAITLTGNWTAWMVFEAPSGDYVPFGNNDGGGQAYIAWQGSNLNILNDANNPVTLSLARPVNTRTAVRVRRVGNDILVKVSGNAEVNLGAPAATSAYTFSALGRLYANFGSVAGSKHVAEVIAEGDVSAEDYARMDAYQTDELNVTP